jgi:hypothetical protein
MVLPSRQSVHRLRGDPGDLLVNRFDLAGVQTGADLDPERHHRLDDLERAADRPGRDPYTGHVCSLSGSLFPSPRACFGTMTYATSLSTVEERIVLRHLLRAETELAQAARRCADAEMLEWIERAGHDLQRAIASARVRLNETRAG